MSKIGPDHMARKAIVYIRQSTADQVAHNPESQKRQYALAERARHLGCPFLPSCFTARPLILQKYDLLPFESAFIS